MQAQERIRRRNFRVRNEVEEMKQAPRVRSRQKERIVGREEPADMIEVGERP